MKNLKQKQHVDLFRKISLRKNLIGKVGDLTGAFYIPFIGDGDIAVKLYRDHKIYGADLDADCVKTAKKRLPGAEILQANCDTFPFVGIDIEYSLADFDAYAYPYKSFREFWQSARLTSPCVLFFTDGEKQAIMRAGHWTMPDGKKNFIKGTDARRVIFNKYWTGTILPWFTQYIKPWRIVETFKYSRKWQFYWGAIIEKDKQKDQKGTILKKPSKRTPYKFDEVKRDAYLKLLEAGEPRGLAANKVGLDSRTPVRYQDKDAAFARAVSEAEITGASYRDSNVVNSLYEAAQSGNVTAIQVWLYNRRPGDWKDKRNVAVTGEGGGPVVIKHNADALINKLAMLAGAKDDK